MSMHIKSLKILIPVSGVGSQLVPETISIKKLKQVKENRNVHVVFCTLSSLPIMIARLALNERDGSCAPGKISQI